MTDFKDMLTRAGWTGLETFLAVVLGSGALDLGATTVQAAGLAAISSGITVVLVWVRQKRADADL
jgi:hypothetical protein